MCNRCKIKKCQNINVKFKIVSLHKGIVDVKIIMQSKSWTNTQRTTFLSSTLSRSSLVMIIQSKLISLKTSNLFQRHCRPFFRFASLKMIALPGVLSFIYGLSLCSYPIKVLPLKTVLMSVLAVLYLAHWIGVALHAILSISCFDFYLFQSPLTAPRTLQSCANSLFQVVYMHERLR